MSLSGSESDSDDEPLSGDDNCVSNDSPTKYTSREAACCWRMSSQFRSCKLNNRHKMWL